MAKYCMFCGNQLPDVAQFCAKCGQKQPVQEPEDYDEKIEDIEDASDEMDLLSQFGFVSTPKPQKKKSPPFQPTTVKKEEIKTEAKQEQVKASNIPPKPVQDKKIPDTPNKNTNSQPISLFEPQVIEINNFIQPTFETTVNSVKKEIPKTITQEENLEIEKQLIDNPINPLETTRKQSSRRQDTPIPFKPTETKKSENSMPVMSDSTVKYDLPEDFNISLDNDTETEALNQEEIEKEKQLKKEFERKRTSGEVDSISAKRQRNNKPIKKKRNVSEFSDDEDFKTELTSRTGETSMMSENTLYADEIKSQELYDELKDIESEDDAPRRKRSSEGRKQVNNNSQKRKRSSRDNDINKKIYKIEHDRSQLDPDEQEYDGYYENVLPLDHDTLQKAKIDPKIILIILGTVALVGLAVFLVLEMLGL